MLLFIQKADDVAGQAIIPSSRVYDIFAVDCRININYDGGELIEVEGTFQKKVETISVRFDSEDDVNKILRQFYKACNAGARAFFFGNDSKG